ncbi:MAG: OmpA family protein [Candidatus Acidiferrales bacterium]
MKLGARIFATMAVAVAIAPALYADGAAKAKTKATKDQPAATATAATGAATAAATPADAAKTPPNTAESAAPVYSTNSLSAFAGGAQPAAQMQTWDESGNYTPKVEWFFGYSFWRAMPTATSNRIGYMHGGSTSVAYNFNQYLGLAADFAGFDDSKLTLFDPLVGNRTVNSSGSVYTLMVGPRLSYRKHERLTPFVQVLLGGVHASAVSIDGCTGAPACTPLGSDTTFAALAGVGVDAKINRHFAWRVIEADYLLTHFENALLAAPQSRDWQNNIRLSTGIVLRFGGNHPPPPPSAPMAATCSADPEFVYAGSGDYIAVRADANNPDNSSLNYSWSADAGAVDGTGPTARWNSSDRAPGTYTIKVRVDNGRIGGAGCSVSVRVAPRPNRPPTISCSADHATVTVGDPVEITAAASDPDNDPLTYSWNASGGRLEGTGANVKLHTHDLPPGSYTITGHVDDGRSGTADCTINVDVQAPQPPPEQVELESRLALHSIYFATARPTEANPTGGLVDSQQNILVSLATDFNRYLTFKPAAHLTLTGHADHRGGIEFNKHLTERRVERAKSFLVEHGVPAANIETRAMGEQDNLDADQVKQLIDQNPDLSDAERQRLDGNLKVIVWANNRRVDISLDTTGQKSVRQYPFNARDAMTLISPKSGKAGTPSGPPSAKKPAQP